jgi:hypothetical protein
LEKGSDFGSNFHGFLLGEIEFQFTKKKICFEFRVIFKSGHEFQILKSPFVFEKERVFEFVKLFPMFLTKFIHLCIFMNFKVCHNQLLQLSQEFKQFSVAEMKLTEFGKQIIPKPMTEIRIFFGELLNWTLNLIS